MSVPCPPRRGYPPADLIRQREMKWVEMTSHWEKTMSRRYKKVRGAWPHPALAKFAPPMSHYLLPFLPTPPPLQSGPCPIISRVRCLPTRAGEAGPVGLMGPTPWPHPQVKMQCRKGIPSALRARCWPLLCGAHVCQKNSPGTYQVKELAGVPPPLPRAPGHSEPLHLPSCLPTGTG